MSTKKYHFFQRPLIILGAFLFGIIVTLVATAAYDAANVKERANSMITDIKANAPVNADPEVLKLYYSAIRTNLQSILDIDIGSLIAVINEVDSQLAVLSNEVTTTTVTTYNWSCGAVIGGMSPPPSNQCNATTVGKNVAVDGAPDGCTCKATVTNTGTPGTSNTNTPPTNCTGTYPKDDPNATIWPTGGFVIGGSSSDQSNKVWKYKYAGTCMFDCKTGYSYNSSKNICEKDSYSWACGFAIGGGATADPAKCNATTVGEYSQSTNCVCAMNGEPKGNPISFSPAVGVFDMASPKTLTSRLNNVKPDNILLCQEIISHPNTNVTKNEGICKNAQYYKPFPGSNQWKYNNGGYDISVPYDATIFGAAGIKTRFFIKDKTTNQVAIYEISVKNSSTTPTTVNPVNVAPPKDIVCTGNVPKDNVMKTTMPAAMGVGDWENTVWQYQYGGSCSWKCANGYKVTADKSACESPKPGSGVSYKLFQENGSPLSGVEVSILECFGSAGCMNRAIGTSNSNGEIELFPLDAIYSTAQTIIKKDGMVISNSLGCDADVRKEGTIGGGYLSFCTNTSLSAGTKISITMKAQPSDLSLAFNPSSCILSMSQKNTCMTKLDGINKSDTLGCYEVIAHPNPNVTPESGKCNDPKNFAPQAEGTGDWSIYYSEYGSSIGKGIWSSNLKYSADMWGAAGIKTRWYMKDTTTGKIATYDISVQQ